MVVNYVSLFTPKNVDFERRGSNRKRLDAGKPQSRAALQRRFAGRQLAQVRDIVAASNMISQQPPQ